jgi:hypothetical protein
MAMEIVENDVVDAAEPAESPSLKMPFKAAKVETPKVETPKAAVIPTAKTAIDMNDGEWTIKSDNVVANLPAVILAANTLLDIAKTEDDLLVIFQKNRKVFDEIQAASPKDYEEIINNFAATKEKLKK